MLIQKKLHLPTSLALAQKYSAFQLCINNNTFCVHRVELCRTKYKKTWLIENMAPYYTRLRPINVSFEFFPHFLPHYWASYANSLQFSRSLKTQNHFKLAFGTDVHFNCAPREYCTRKTAMQRNKRKNGNNKLKHYFAAQTRKLSN